MNLGLFYMTAGSKEDSDRSCVHMEPPVLKTDHLTLSGPAFSVVRQAREAQRAGCQKSHVNFNSVQAEEKFFVFKIFGTS